MTARVDWLRFVSVLLCCFGVGLLLTLACTVLTGCGPRFTADDPDLFPADASTDASLRPDAASEAGAAGDTGTGGAVAIGGAGAGGTVSQPPAAGAGGAPTGQAGAASAGSAGALAVGGGGAGGATPCGVAGWSASAFASYDPPVGGLPSAALDGDEGTRWASGQEQAAGQWFRVDLPAGTVLEQLELEAAPADMPPVLELELDGAAVVATQSRPDPSVLRLVLAKPTPARVLRLLVVTPEPGQWWSIRELRPVCR
jgi:endo-1,3(4)-beta-glucanase